MTDQDKPAKARPFATPIIGLVPMDKAVQAFVKANRPKAGEKQRTRERKAARSAKRSAEWS